MTSPTTVDEWTCGGELREGADNPYFRGECVRVDGAARLRFLGAP